MRKAWHQFKRRPAKERTFNGILFASVLEMNVYRNLLLMQEAGEIKNLKRQVKYPLILPNGVAIKTRTGRTAVYTPDFEYDDVLTGSHYIIEVKGWLDNLSQLRIAIFEAIYNLKITMVRK